MIVPEVTYKYEARSRLIAIALKERTRIFRMMQLADEQGETEQRDKLFEQWKELTGRIEALNR